MSFKPTVKIEPDDIVRYLLYQQFYYGEDRIYGRTKDRFEYIEGAGRAIDDFYSLITQSINLVDEGNPDQYLEFFNKNVHKIPIKTIMDKYRDYKDNLGSNMNRVMKLTVIFGDCLTEIHKECFEAKIIQLIELIMEKRSLESKQKAEIKKKIESLYGKSNPYIGMIYSLSFMEFIGKKIRLKNIVVKCEDLFKKYFDLILSVLE